jgi:O-methyltransferase
MMAKNILKYSLNSILGHWGYEIHKLQPDGEIDFPVELDESDRSIIDYVFANNLTMVSHARLIATLLACKYACQSGVEGDFVECGVWRGGNALVAADVFFRAGAVRKIYLFDTFAGMTEPRDIDVKLKEKFDTRSKFVSGQRSGYNEWCMASLDEVRRAFDQRGLLGMAKFVEGDVVDTLAEAVNLPAKISVLRLDTDWYESTKTELTALWPRLERGGILILDDYGHWLGSKKAFDEVFPVSSRPFLHYVDDAARLVIKL